MNYSLAQSVSSENTIILYVSLFFIFGFAIVKLIKNSNHAYKKHSTEAQVVEESYRKNGFIRCYVEEDGMTYHLLVEIIPNEKYGTLIIIKDKSGKIYEKTAFCPKDGSFYDIMKWLKNKKVKIANNPLEEN